MLRKLTGVELLAKLAPMTRARREMFLLRRYILQRKEQWSTARGIIHYKRYVADYLACKRIALQE